MSAVAAPFGLRPVYHPSGYIRTVAGSIASAHATNIFLNSPVAIVAGTGKLALAAAAARAMGAFMGVEFTPADGRRRLSNTWPTGTVATQIVAYYTRDPYIVYEIQGTGSFTEDEIGEAGDWSTNDTNAGNTTTGLSNVSMAAASAAANGLQILGLSPYIDNDWGDAFTIVEVRILEHQLLADSTAF